MRCCHANTMWSSVIVLCLPMLLVTLTGCPITAPDVDGDGVPDSADACADTPAGAEVDAAGCALSQLDSDGDGVTDDLDECADTPGTVSVDAAGCPVSQPGTPDTDGDGVPDDIDQCPGTPAGEAVDANGCSEAQIDADGDGVPNDIDECADTPPTVPVDEVGCPVSAPGTPDTDGDGVPDDIDQCAETLSGAAVDPNGCADSQKDSDDDGVTDDIDQCAATLAGASVDQDGCADSQKDSDGDGVTDDVDQCAETPAGASVDENGCAASQRDSDDDGVTDDLDECPNTPDGANVDANGCALSQLDSDGDGVSDAIDQCPNTPPGTTVDSTGCEVTEPPPTGETAKSWNVAGDVLFAGVLEPRTYHLTAEVGSPLRAALTEARVTLSDDLVADPDTTVFTETVPLAVPTTLATAVIPDVLNGPLPLTFGTCFDQFFVAYDWGGSDQVCPVGKVCWEFDITITTVADLSGITSVSSTRHKGTQSGALSGDGKTITWTTISGTRTIKLYDDRGTCDDDSACSVLEQDCADGSECQPGAVQETVDGLQDIFDTVPVGSWALVE